MKVPTLSFCRYSYSNRKPRSEAPERSHRLGGGRAGPRPCVSALPSASSLLEGGCLVSTAQVILDIDTDVLDDLGQVLFLRPSALLLLLL